MLHLAVPQRARARGRVFSVAIETITGRVVRSENRNIIVRPSLASWLQQLISAQPYLTTCHVGTGLTVPTDTDTALTTPLTSKSIGTWDTTNATGANPYIIARTQFDESEAIANITEVGLFNSTPAMFNHALFGMGVPTAATQADPVVITDADHGLVDGQRVRFDGVGGMTELNFVATNYYYVDVLSSSTFALYNDAALTDTLDGTGFGAFSGGTPTWKISIPKTASTILVVRVEIELANA